MKIEEPYMYTIPCITRLLDEEQIEYLRIEPLPFETTSLDINDFKNNIIIRDRYNGEPISDSGHDSLIHVCEMEIKNEPVYFYIIDDPGASGYNCCGAIIIRYTFSFEQFQNVMKQM